MQLCTVPVQWKALLYISMKLSAKAAIKNNCIVLMMASRSLRPWCHCWRPSRSSYVPWWSWYMYYWDVCRCQSWAPASWFAQTHHRIIDAKEKKPTHDVVLGIGGRWLPEGEEGVCAIVLLCCSKFSLMRDAKRQWRGKEVKQHRGDA